MPDLPALIARLREARPELAGSLPESRGFRWTIGQDMDRHELPSVVVEPILIGVCAEWCAEHARTVEPWPTQREWLVREKGKVLGLIVAPDFPSALVEAVIGEGRE